jgi:hypothetical protein
VNARSLSLFAAAAKRRRKRKSRLTLVKKLFTAGLCVTVQGREGGEGGGKMGKEHTTEI